MLQSCFRDAHYILNVRNDFIRSETRVRFQDFVDWGWNRLNLFKPLRHVFGLSDLFRGDLLVTRLAVRSKSHAWVTYDPPRGWLSRERVISDGGGIG